MTEAGNDKYKSLSQFYILIHQPATLFLIQYSLLNEPKHIFILQEQLIIVCITLNAVHLNCSHTNHEHGSNELNTNGAMCSNKLEKRPTVSVNTNAA